MARRKQTNTDTEQTSQDNGRNRVEDLVGRGMSRQAAERTVASEEQDRGMPSTWRDNLDVLRDVVGDGHLTIGDVTVGQVRQPEYRVSKKGKKLLCLLEIGNNWGLQTVRDLRQEGQPGWVIKARVTLNAEYMPAGSGQDSQTTGQVVDW